MVVPDACMSHVVKAKTVRVSNKCDDHVSRTYI